ncbi:unnamed protein product [Fusarium graminearum]|uniref:Uncharacterized protein n=1 Tax=Gibberella zeae TaxID=5518 RepID=A0A4E9E525_GIBZA
MGHAYKSNLKNLDRLLIQHLESERETENAALQLPDKARPHLCPIPPRHRSLLHLRQPVTHEGGGEECTRTQFIQYICSLSWGYTGNHYHYQMLRRSERRDCNGPFDVNWGRVCSPLDLSLIQE